MIYLRRELVFNDLNQFAKATEKRWNLAHVEVYKEENESSSSLKLGYSFEHKGKRIIITMPYSQNDRGELAISNKVWELHIGDEKVEKEFLILGDVIDFALESA